MQIGEAKKLLRFFCHKARKTSYIYKYILRRLIYDKQNFEKNSMLGHVLGAVRFNDRDRAEY